MVANPSPLILNDGGKPPPPETSAGGPKGPDMEARFSMVEYRLSKVEDLLNKIDGQIRDLAKSLGAIEGRIGTIEGRMQGLPTTWAMVTAALGSPIVVVLSLVLAFKALGAHF